MDNSIYTIMQNLKETKSSKDTKDIRYLGTISQDKETPNRKCYNYKRCICYDRCL